MDKMNPHVVGGITAERTVTGLTDSLWLPSDRV